MTSPFLKTFPLLSFLLAPAVAFAAPPPTDFKSLLLLFVNLINLFIPALFAVAFMLVIWGAFKYIQKGNERTLEEARNLILYGIIGLAVMFSVWGLEKIIENTFFHGSRDADIYSCDQQNQIYGPGTCTNSPFGHF